MLPSRFDLPCGLRITHTSELTAWLKRAQPGERVVYHHGLLVVDRGPTSSLGEGEHRRLDALATAVGAAAAAGLVHPLQQRLTAGAFAYIALKAIPSQAAASNPARPYGGQGTAAQQIARQRRDREQQSGGPRRTGPTRHFAGRVGT